MTTPNLALSVTSEGDGSTVSFLNWRLMQDGTSGSSNMGKIDTWAGLVSGSLTSLSASAILLSAERVHVIISSGNGTSYTATNSNITSYFEGLMICAVLDTETSDNPYLNINSLGNVFLKKVVDGFRVNVISGEITSGAYTLLIYDSGDFIWVGYVAGGGGSTDTAAIHVNASSEIHGITEKTNPVDDDEVVIEDSADGYSKKRVKKSNLNITYAYVNVSGFLATGLTAGYLGECQAPSGSIVEASIYGDTSGCAVVDVWKSTYANLPIDDTDSITSASPITLTSAQKTTGTALTGWNKIVADGDWLGFNLDSVSGLTRITVTLKIRRT